MSKDAASTPPDHTYRARVGERAFDVVFQDGRLLVDGEPVAYAFEPVSEGCFALLLDGRSYPVVIEPGPNASASVRVTLAGRQVAVQVQDERALLLERFGLSEHEGPAESAVHAPMPGLVLAVLVEPGQPVQPGDGLLVLEAMKMENELRAHAPGVVKALHAAPGDAVSKNDLLVEFDA